MKVAEYTYLGPTTTPRDIKNLRQSNIDSNRIYGMPIVHKHKWNEKDVREGKAQYCPVDHDDAAYPQGRSWCPYCFGTGYFGGYDDAVMVWVTLADAQEDTIKFTPAGQVERVRTPGLSAPWTPKMGDGDLIITGQFNDFNDIVTEEDRYELREVTQRTMRGFQRQVQTQEFVWGQDAMIEFLPYNHPLYEVPLVFDYAQSIPGSSHTSTERTLKIVGQAFKATTSTTVDLRIMPVGVGSTFEMGLRITGKGATHSHV